MGRCVCHNIKLIIQRKEVKILNEDSYLLFAQVEGGYVMSYYKTFYMKREREEVRWFVVNIVN